MRNRNLLRHLVVWLFFCTCSTSVSAAPGDTLASFTINNLTGDGRTPTSPQGITYYNGYLWVVDFGTDRIYRVYPNTVYDTDGTTVLFNPGDSDLNLPLDDANDPPINSDGNPIARCRVDSNGNNVYCGGGGLAFALNFLWNASPVTDDIIKIDPVDGDNLESENTLATVAFPSPTDLTYDGTHFWIVDWQSNTVNRVLPEDGSVIATLPAPSTLPSYTSNPSVTNARPWGIAWDGQALWVTEQQERRIYRISATDGSLLDWFDAPGTDPKGIAWDGEFLWHVDQANQTIYKLESGVIPFGIIGCIEKNGQPVNGDVLLSQTAIPDQANPTDGQGCFVFPTFTSGVPIQVKVSETGVDEKPVITLAQTSPGNTSVTLIVGDTYSEPGFTATDSEDGDITASVIATPNVINTPSIIDTSAPNPTGVQVAYNVVDSAGNLADTVYRMVYVLEVDSTAPTITLTGANPFYVEQGTSYVEPGATAMDDRDGDISANITITGLVNAAVAGTYPITYNVSDSTGNAATAVTRNVIVRDTTVPVITLAGANPMTLERGTAFVDPGASASDNINGDITANIVVTGSVTNSTVGSYVLNYNVSDSAGNAAVTRTRTVNVVDTTAPVITLIGPATYNQELNTPFTDPGATATDVPSIDLSGSIVVTGTVNTAVAGSYTLNYNVTDSHGNAATTVTRTVVVADTGAPTITILGANPLAHERGTPYTDPGATASDAIDGNLTASIVATGSVNVNATGSYNISYNVTDSTGNAAVTQTRVVNVADTTRPVITLTGNAVVLHELGVAYTDAGATATDNIDGNISASIVRTGTVNTAVAGIYTLSYNVSDSSGNAATTVTRTVNVSDRTPPVITLVGANPLNHEVGSIFVDPGATALDNTDGNISANIGVTGTVNASVVGSYNLTYRVSDAAGNAAAPVVRTVNVADTGAPVITMTGNSPINHEINTPYTDAGATATDALDGNLTSSIVTVNNVNTTVAGTYTVTYNVTDSNGNSAVQQVRTVNVNDFTRPVITLLGSATVNVELASSYTDAGATASDNVDGNLTSSIVTTGSVNVMTAGTYLINYNVTDAAGNTATQVTRTVIVGDRTKPVINLNGSATINHQQGTVYSDPGAGATDNIDGNLTSSIIVSGFVDANVAATYLLRYNVSDSSGNAADTVTRTVIVADTIPPVITRIGAATINHQQGTAYTDAGATASDNINGNITASITVSGSVNVNVAGTYVLTYNVVDAAGNAATPVTRTVTVADTIPPVITRIGAATISHQQGTAYTDAGATASDNINGNITASIVVSGSVNANVAGSYVLTYNVSDAAGNAATPVTRTVNVVDTLPPTLTLLGSATMDHSVGEIFTDPGYTASDVADGNLTASVVVSGSINVNTPGTYVLTYNVSDAAGNAATPRTRTVNVVSPSTINREAETATIGGSPTVASTETGFTGSGYISLATATAGSYLEYSFNGYALPYDLVIRHAATAPITVDIILNGSLAGQITLVSSGGMNLWQTSAALTLTPQSGANTLRINIPGAAAQNLDSLTITPQ